MNMHPIVHFEMPGEETKRMVEFYSRAFGWQAKQLGPEMGNYVLVQTAETGEDGMLKQPGQINGGFFQRTKDNQHLSVVIAVEDIRASMMKVEETGGQILGGQKPGEPGDIPGVGLYASFIDTEGNRVGMLQPVPMKDGA